MRDMMQTPDWTTAFDWEQADAQARSSAALSSRLLAVLRERGAVTAHLAAGEAAGQFGRYVAALRRARGWSRPQLAEQAGIDPLAVPLLEEAALTPEELSPGLVGRLARAFEIPLEALPVNPAPQRAATESFHFGRWLRAQLLASAPVLMQASLSASPAMPVPYAAPAAPAGAAPLGTAALGPPRSGGDESPLAPPPMPSQAVPPLPARARAAAPLRKTLRPARSLPDFSVQYEAAAVPEGSVPEAAARPGAGGGDLPTQIPSLGAVAREPAVDADPALTAPISLPALELRLPGGQVARALLRLELSDPPPVGLADLSVLLLDAAGHPLPGKTITLELAARSFAGAWPSDRQGHARIQGLALPHLLEAEALTLHVS